MVSFFLSLASGLLLSAAFAPLNWWFSLPLSIALFLYAVTKTRHSYFVAIGFLPTFGFNLFQAWPSITGMAGTAIAARMR